MYREKKTTVQASKREQKNKKKENIQVYIWKESFPLMKNGTGSFPDLKIGSLASFQASLNLTSDQNLRPHWTTIKENM